MSSKIILDLCGGTGAWSKPFSDAGFDVRIITLPEYDVNDWGFVGNKLYFFNQLDSDKRMIINANDIFGVFAAPPCTEFSIAKSGSKRDFDKGMDIVESCLRIIWFVQKHTRLNFWAMENPTGLLRRFIGKPVMRFEQWQFGDDGIKPTDLWGYFNQPSIKVKKRPNKLKLLKYPNGRSKNRKWGNPKVSSEYEHLKLDRAAIRAITPPGFAMAFFKANKKERKV